MDIEELKKLSRKQQGKQLDRIKEASQTYIHGSFKNSLREKIKKALLSSDFDIEKFIVSDEDDTQQQTLLIHYPSIITEKNDYIKSTIKVEAGAKSALDPHQLITIQPYIAPELSALNLSVPNIAVIDAERTFWDRIMILHGIRSRKKNCTLKLMNRSISLSDSTAQWILFFMVNSAKLRLTRSMIKN